MEDKKPEQEKGTPENVHDLKKQTTDTEEVKKGYNEKNPAQEEGAFTPDSNEE
ncbi:MAG: hypothetical protein ABIT96_03065 [Ferruginibacter sp.]